MSATPSLALSSAPNPAARCGRLAARLAVGTALLLTSGLFCREFYRHFAHSKSFALWLLVLIAVVGALAGWRHSRWPTRCSVEGRRWRLALLAVGVVWTASLLVALNIGHGLEQYMRIAPILVIGWWSAQMPLSWRRVSPWATGVVFLTSVVVLILGLLQYDVFQDWLYRQGTEGQELYRWLREDWGLLRHSRWLSTLGNPNSAGCFYAATLSFALGVAALSRSWWCRACGLALFILLCLALSHAHSRTGIVSSMAGIAAVAVAWTGCLPGRGRLGHAVRVAATVTLIVGVVIWIGVLAWLSGAGQEDLEEFSDGLAVVWATVTGQPPEGFMDRLYIWNSAARMVRDHPLLGIGFAQFPLVYPLYTQPSYYELWGLDQLITTEEAHSGHLNLAVETGLIGALTWGALLALAWAGAMRRMRWAAAGDEAARSVIIWFPLAMALLAHMAVDKYWAYPAALTLMMWSLGQLMRPRTVTLVARPSPRWSWTAGGVGLVLALALALPAMQIVAGSHALTSARMKTEESRGAAARVASARSEPERIRLRVAAQELFDETARWLDDCRQYAWWEIDSWTRSLDFRTFRVGFLDEHSIQEWLRGSVRVSPNYYPVKRNLASLMAQEAMAVRSSDPAEHERLLDLGLRLYQQVVALRPNDPVALANMMPLLNLIGDQDGVRECQERFVAIRGVDLDRANPIRVALAQSLIASGEYERGIAHLETALERPVGISEFALWMRIAHAQVQSGDPAAAWGGLAERINNITSAQLSLLNTRVSELQGNVRTLEDLWETSLALVALGGSERAVSLIQTSSPGDAEVNAVFSAVLARMVSTELCRSTLATARERWPDSELITEAERALLR